MENQPAELWDRIEKPGARRATELYGRALSAATLAGDLSDQTADGYLEILDSNNTCLDYDIEADDRWLDLDFGERLRVRHRTPRRHG